MTNTNTDTETLRDVLLSYPGGILALGRALGVSPNTISRLAQARGARVPSDRLRAVAEKFAHVGDGERVTFERLYELWRRAKADGQS